jgi:hypothetical protein
MSGPGPGKAATTPTATARNVNRRILGLVMNNRVNLIENMDSEMLVPRFRLSSQSLYPRLFLSSLDHRHLSYPCLVVGRIKPSPFSMRLDKPCPYLIQYAGLLLGPRKLLARQYFPLLMSVVVVCCSLPMLHWRAGSRPGLLWPPELVAPDDSRPRNFSL